jgi:hypothetical protein
MLCVFLCTIQSVLTSPHSSVSPLAPHRFHIMQLWLSAYGSLYDCTPFTRRTQARFHLMMTA